MTEDGRGGLRLVGDAHRQIGLGQPVQRLGAQLLAGAALAADEDGRTRGGDILQDAVDRLHGGGAADHAGKGTVAIHLLQRRQRAGEALALQRVLDGDAQPVGTERLDDEVEGALAH